MVIELPTGPLICIAMDLSQRWILDMGLPGPDAGGRHLLLPAPGWEGEAPEGYHRAGVCVLGARGHPLASGQRRCAGRRQAPEDRDRVARSIPKSPGRPRPGSTSAPSRRTRHYEAIGSSPAMFRRAVRSRDRCSRLGLRDGDGGYLDGGKAYALNVPLPVPGTLFWSVTVYDARTRSQIQTGQGKAVLAIRLSRHRRRQVDHAAIRADSPGLTAPRRGYRRCQGRPVRLLSHLRAGIGCLRRQLEARRFRAGLLVAPRDRSG